MAFSVRSGSFTSSIIYRICRDGRASMIRTIAGRIVQTSSISWASTVLDVSFSVSIMVSRYSTRLQMARAVIRAWSWNSTSSSMIGDEASWKPNCMWLAICVEVYWGFTCNLVLTRLCNGFTNTSNEKEA